MRPFRWLAVAAAAVVVPVLGVAGFVATLDPNAYRGEILATLAQATGRKVEIGGPLGLTWMPWPKLTASGIRVANADWGSEPDMASVGRLDVGVALMPLLSGRIEIHDLRLSDVRLVLERAADGRGNWQALGGQATGEPSAGGAPGNLPAIGDVDLANIVVVWKPVPEAAEQLYRIDRLSLARAGAGGATAIALAAEVDGRMLELTGTLPALAAMLVDTVLPVDVTGSWAGKPVALKTDIRVGRGPDGAIRTASTERIDASFGDLAAAGSGSVDLSGARPRVDAAVEAAILDFAKLGGEGGQADSHGGSPLDRPLSVDLLSGIDGRIAFRIGRLLANPWAVDDLSGTATVEAGMITVDPVSATLAGGPVAGRAELDGRKAPMRLALAGTARGMNMGEIYRVLSSDALIEGQGTAALDLRGRGNTARALLASSDGVAHLVVRDGTIENKYWELIAEDLATRFIPFAGGSGSGRLNCLVGRFDIAKGIADATVLMVDSDRVTVGGGGTVDLGRQTLDLKLVPQPKDPSLLSLATPILLTGPIADPTPTPDPVGVARGIGGLAAGAMIGPLGLLLPFVSSGSADEPCPDAIAAAEGRQRPGAAKSREQSEKPGSIKGLFDSLRKPFE